MTNAYTTISTGAQLIDAGVIPKSSSELMTLIAYERLKALRDRASHAVDPDRLGAWEPLFVAHREPTDKSDAADPDRVEYIILASAVADTVLGHKVRFEDAYSFRTSSKEGGLCEVPAGTVGSLVKYIVGRVTIHFDQQLDYSASQQTFELEVDDDLVSILVVSSLGQMVPGDLDTAIRDDVLEKFFPTTILDSALAEHVVIGLLMGKDLIFNGPPGSGKTNVVEDLKVLMESYAPHLFKVEGCQVQCDPFSLWDEAHRKDVTACPECQIRHDDAFRKTNRFQLSDPADVAVTVANRSEGMGIEQIGGNIAVQLSDLTGFKPPTISTDGTVRSDASDPVGFQAGKLIRTNNGLLIIDEIDKLHRTTMDGLLNALAKQRVMPADLRSVYPAHALVLGTSNDSTRFSDALRDRILLFEVGYPTDPEITHQIVRRACYGEQASPADIPIGDIYAMKPFLATDIAIPVVLEKAVSSLFTNLRSTRDIEGMNEVMLSSRSMLDALAAARAFAWYDQVFDGNVRMVLERHVVSGIGYALAARVTAVGSDRTAVTSAIDTYLQESFARFLAEENDAWWCSFFKSVAIIDKAIGGTFAAKLESNMALYASLPSTILPAFRSVRDALEDPRIALEYPFMATLLREHTSMADLHEDAVEPVITYLLERQASSQCKL